MEYELISSDEDDTYPTSPSSNTEVNAEEAPMDPGTDLAYSATFSISMENSVSSQGYLSTVTAQLQTEVSFNDTTLQAESLVSSEIMVSPQYQEIPVIVISQVSATQVFLSHYSPPVFVQPANICLITQTPAQSGILAGGPLLYNPSQWLLTTALHPGIQFLQSSGTEQIYMTTLHQSQLVSTPPLPQIAVPIYPTPLQAPDILEDPGIEESDEYTDEDLES